MKNGLLRIIGVEQDIDDISRSLRKYVRSLNTPVVGAMHVTCADESEWECVESFQHRFVDDLLPDLKHTEKAPFRLSNLGGRYEEGAIPVAEHHFATHASQSGFKVLVVKVNAHVGVISSGEGYRFGKMQRYDTESAACGALHALLAGGDKPFLNELRSAFQSEGTDRLALLLDEHRINPRDRSLFVAIVNAELQARRVVLEIQQHKPASPTLYLVASCVTLNRIQRDTELLCGLYTADCRTEARITDHVGLGNDPTRYKARYDDGRLHVEVRD